MTNQPAEQDVPDFSEEEFDAHDEVLDLEPEEVPEREPEQKGLQDPEADPDAGAEHEEQGE